MALAVCFSHQHRFTFLLAIFTSVTILIRKVLLQTTTIIREREKTASQLNLLVPLSAAAEQAMFRTSCGWFGYPLGVWQQHSTPPRVSHRECPRTNQTQSFGGHRRRSTNGEDERSQCARLVGSRRAAPFRILVPSYRVIQTKKWQFVCVASTGNPNNNEKQETPTGLLRDTRTHTSKANSTIKRMPLVRIRARIMTFVGGWWYVLPVQGNVVSRRQATTITRNVRNNYE